MNWDTCAKLNEKWAEQLTKGWASGGDVLLTHNATVGRVARVEPDVGQFLLGTSVTFYRLSPNALNPDFFFYVLRSPLWQRQLEAIMAQTTRNQVSIQKQASFQIVVPPIAEQHRIVAKVDELMALCDRLEASLATADDTRRRLLEALLAEALQPSAAPEPEAAHLTDAEVAQGRQRRLAAMRLHEIEGNPLSAEQVAMFEMFEREAWTHERRRAYLLAKATTRAAE